MASPIYFPNPVSALPEPRFYTPQRDMSAGLQGAMSGLISVANNYQRKQASVQSAERMADVLESQGLDQEAAIYRQAAQSFDTNFFSTPEENDRFNRSVLTDALKLVTEQKDREVRLSSQRIQDEYYRSLIQNQKDATAARVDAKSLADDERELARIERARVNNARLLGGRLDDIRLEANELNNQMEAIQSGVAKGTVDPNSPDVRRAAAAIQARKKQLGEEYNEVNAQFRAVLSSDERGNSPEVKVSKFNPLYSEGDPLSGITPQPDLQVQENQAAINALRQNPELGRIGDVSRIPPGTTTTTVGPQGTTTQTRVPNVDAATKGVPGIDPNAPGVGKPFNPNKF